MNRKPTFFTSDWHISHEKSIQFDQRPFKTLDEMHTSLIVRYNACVPDNGICYFLGDMGNKPKEIAEVVRQLKGTKVLFLGNHDKGMTTMYNCGFDVVMYGGWIYVGDIKVTMSHCPFIGVLREDTSSFNRGIVENWHGETRTHHLKSAVKDDGQFLLHGHIHSRKGKDQSVKILDRQYDVGCVANNYTPVSLSTIESWVANYK